MAHIAIIGGGTSGLACALAIAQSGCHQVSVYEAQSRAPAHNVGVHLPPNASRVLRALGIADLPDTIAIEPVGLQTNTAHLGFELSRLPLGDFVHERYGAPYYLVRHETLLTQLEQAVTQADVSVYTAYECTDIDGKLCQFGNGERVVADLIIRADGANSRIQQDTMATSSGSKYHLSEGFAAEDSLAIVRWLGNNQLVTQCPLPREIGSTAASHWVQWVRPATNEVAQTNEQASGNQPSAHPALHASASALLHNLSRVPITDRAPNPNWQGDAWVVLGGAAQPIGSHLLYGEAIALEEAWVLGRFLEQLEEDPTKAATEYVRFRQRRRHAVYRAQHLALAQDMTDQHWRKAKRNLKLTLGSRFLPELALSRLDWLFGYDCVRGFH